MNFLLAARQLFNWPIIFGSGIFNFTLSLLSIREKYVTKVKVYAGFAGAQHKANIPLAVVVNKMCLIKKQKKMNQREKIAMKTKATTKAKDNNCGEQTERVRENAKGVPILMN